jgi:beta-xylosidase
MPHSTSGLLLLSCIAVISHAVLRAGANYSNPIVQQDGFDLGDPGALFYDGFYYLATSSGDRQNAFPIRRSADLVTYQIVGHVFPDWNATGQVSWATGDFWAPDLQIVNGSFACYFSARNAVQKRNLRGYLSLGVAFSTSVTGPYVDLGQPLWADPKNPQGTIDVHFHRDASSPTGEQYLLWKANQDPPFSLKAKIQMQQLASSGRALVGEAWTVATADQRWEEAGCVEAPWLVQRNGSYYLFYR